MKSALLSIQQRLAQTGEWGEETAAILSHPWCIRFLLGAGLALILYVSGGIFTSFHDRIWTPFLFGGLLRMPVRWVVTGGLAAALVWKEDKGSAFNRWMASMAGVWFAVLMLYRVWYYYPFLVVFWTSFLSWRIGWKLWSYKGVVAAMLALPATAILAAGFSWDDFPWDDRFSLGLSPGWNAVMTASFLLASSAGVAAMFLFLRKTRVVVRPARPKLLDLVRIDPRLSRYFDATLKVTANQIPDRCGAEGRNAMVVETQIPRSNGSPQSDSESTTGLASWLNWNIGFAALRLPGVAATGRLLRSSLRKPGLPGEAVHRILDEEMAREHCQWCELRNRPGAIHFARYLSLREARIEAAYYFGRQVPPAPSCEAILSLIRAAPEASAAADLRQKSPPIWPLIAREYEVLWFENCERLFLIKGPSFGAPLLSEADLLDANSIRAALKNPDEGSAWVVDRLKKAGVFGRIDLEQADPQDDPRRMQLVHHLNELIEKAAPVPTGPTAGNLLDRQAPARQTVWTSRRAEMMAARANLEAAFPGAIAPSTDVVNFEQLTVACLRCRMASTVSENIHARAVTAALGLFVLDSGDPAGAMEASQFLKGRYLGLHQSEGTPLWRTAKTPEEVDQAALCATLYSLWLASLGNWRDAGSVLALGIVDLNNPAIGGTVRRAAAHLNALHFEWRVRQRPEEADMVAAERVVRMFKALDQTPPALNMLFARAIPGQTLAECFAARLETLLE